MNTARNTICLWYDRDAEAAARFYAETFPDSAVHAVHRAPGDYPSGKKGDVLTVEFTVLGIPCLGLNGGPAFRHSEAFSFQVATVDQAETDRYWNAIVGNGGAESECGWCKDRWGLSWQITPLALTHAITDPDPARPGSRAASLARWFAAADMLLAACSASAAVVLLSMAEGQGIAILGALPMLVAAALFLVAHLALRREWAGRWLWQIAGPATVVLFLFGTAVALTLTAVAAFLSRSVPRNGASRDGST